MFGAQAVVNWAQASPLAAFFAFLVAVPVLFVLGIPVHILTAAYGRWAWDRLLGQDPYANLPSPTAKGAGLAVVLGGDIPARHEGRLCSAERRWVEELGPIMSTRSLLFERELLLVDPRAVMHVLSQQQSYSFPKAPTFRKFVDKLIGRGIVHAEGEQHKRQRRIISPAFSTTAIRDVTPVFFKCSNQLVAKIEGMVDATEGPSDTPLFPAQTPLSAKASAKGKPVLDISYWLSRATLDIIGESAFGEIFDTIDAEAGQDTNELAAAFKKMLTSVETFGVGTFLATYLCTNLPLDWLMDRIEPSFRALKGSYDKMHEMGEAIVAKKKQEILEEMKLSGGQLRKSDFEDRSNKSVDIMTLIMRANMASDIKDSERMSDGDVIGQIMSEWHFRD